MGVLSWQSFTALADGFKRIYIPAGWENPLPVQIVYGTSPSPFAIAPITNTNVNVTGIWPQQGGGGGQANPFRPVPGRPFNISFNNTGAFVGSFFVARQFTNVANFPSAATYIPITNFGVTTVYTDTMSEVFLESEESVDYVINVTCTGGFGALRISQ